MPVVAIESKKKSDLPYLFPKTGKIKLYLESSVPVDIYIVSASQLVYTTSVSSAIMNHIYVLQAQQKVDNLILNMPAEWSSQTWYLVIGNSTEHTAAVYYMVYAG